MAISVNWLTRVINVPQADLTFISGSLYELDVDAFRLTLKDLEDNEEGILFQDTHQHNTEVTVGGVTLARVFEIINDYTVTFEDGQYTVRCVSANHNISDVKNVNQVSLIIGNTAGLIADQIDTTLRKILQNKQITDPVTGKLKIYDDDDSTVLLEADIFEDADGGTPYGSGSQQIERRNRLDTP